MKESICIEDVMEKEMLTMLDFPAESSLKEMENKAEKMRIEKNAFSQEGAVFREIAAKDFSILLNDFSNTTLKKYFSSLLHHEGCGKLSRMEEMLFDEIMIISLERLRTELKKKECQDVVL